MMRSLILDRDGVINQDAPTGIHNPSMWKAIPGSLEAIADLNRAGWQVFVITNQSGIARRYYSLEDLSDIHEKMMRELAAVGGFVQEIFFCPHHPDEGCACRKPKPGLFEQCRNKYNVDLENVYFVGDKVSDLEAAVAAGCRPALVLTGYGKTVSEEHALAGVPVFADLAAFAAFLIKHNSE